MEIVRSDSAGGLVDVKYRCGDDHVCCSFVKIHNALRINWNKYGFDF